MAISKKDKIPLICPKGKTFRHAIYLKDKHQKAIILDSYTARIEIRDELPTEASVPGDDNVIFTLTTDNGMIEIDEDAGKVTFEISPSDTASFNIGTYFWELELVSPDGEIPYIMDISKFKVINEVTLNV